MMNINLNVYLKKYTFFGTLTEVCVFLLEIYLRPILIEYYLF